jgi:hypothetical protein
MDFVAEMHAVSIERVRHGDVGAAQKLLVVCASVLRDQTPDGQNYLAAPYATYLAEVFEKLARSEDTAKLFCLDMPAYRPKKDDASLHVRRALSIYELKEHGATTTQAIAQVASAEQRSEEAVRASWKKGRLVAGIQGGRFTGTTKTAEGKSKRKGIS